MYDICDWFRASIRGHFVLHRERVYVIHFQNQSQLSVVTVIFGVRRLIGRLENTVYHRLVVRFLVDCFSCPLTGSVLDTEFNKKRIKMSGTWPKVWDQLIISEVASSFDLAATAIVGFIISEILSHQPACEPLPFIFVKFSGPAKIV